MTRFTARTGRLVAVLVVAIAMSAVVVSTAAAHVAKTKVRFELTYSSSYITGEGEVVCKGFHETNSELFPGNETEGGRDRESCKSSIHKKFTALTGGEEGSEFPGSPSYESDYFYMKGERGESITSTKVHFAVKPNDKVFTLLVYVPLEGKYPAIAESL